MTHPADDMLLEIVKPLIPEWLTGKVEEIGAALSLLACLKGGVVVGGVRIEINVSQYTEPDEEE